MKFFIVLAVFVCCACAAPLKNELVQRANALDQRIKAEVKRLQAEKREHLALALQEEEKRVETLVSELQKTADTEEVKTAVLEQQLITMEFRVENEINVLQREHETQELLLSNAKVLKQWVSEEIKILENTEGRHREQAQQVARALRREEQRLEQIAQELTRAQDQRRIEAFEVELRALEVRLYEALRALHFDPSTAHPTGSTHPATHATGRPTTGHATARPTTGHATARPTTGHATARPTTGHATARPTTGHATARPSTHRATAAHSTVTAHPTTRAPVTAH